MEEKIITKLYKIPIINYIKCLLLVRNEHNVAVVQLKNKLKFGPDSKYNPICLPQCDTVCRTRTGLGETDLEGAAVVASRATWQHDLQIISNTKCKKIIIDSNIIDHYLGAKYYVQADTIKR